MFSKRRFRRRNKPSSQNLLESGQQQEVPFIPPVQTKLNIGKPGDVYEVEADKTADAVVSKTNAVDSIQKMGAEEEEVQTKPLSAGLTPFVQKQEAAEDEEPLQAMAEKEEEPVQMQEEEEEAIQAKCEACEKEDNIQKLEAEEEEPVQTKRQNDNATNNGISAQLKSTKGGGSPMEESTKSEMEQAFGSNFSQVNIHTDASAKAMNKKLKAQAFTHGNDIYFNSGKYNPKSKKGKHLLAHELTHTIQQGGSKETVQPKLSVEDDYPESYVNFAQTARGVSDPKGEDPSKALSKKERLDVVKPQLDKLSPHFTMDSSGNVNPSGTKEVELKKDDKATASCCMHVLTRAESTDWQILVADHLAPHTEEGSRKVLINSNLSPVKFGSHDKAGEKFSYENDPELILGHELCGHAALMEIDAHTDGERDITNDHDATINIENEIAKDLEKDKKPRGLASDGPHKGESFGHTEVVDFDFNGSTIKPEGKERLKLLADMIRVHNLFVDIRGHSDNVGSEAAKQKISDSRAKRVFLFLRKLNVALKTGVTVDPGKQVKINRFLLKGMSDKEPIAGVDPTTEQHRLRRVDVIVSGVPAGLSEFPPGVPKGVKEKLKKFDKVKEPEKVQDHIDCGTPCEKLLSEKAYNRSNKSEKPDC